METLLKSLKSRTNLTLVGIFIVGGLNALNPYLSPEAQQLLIAVLTALGILFRTFPKQDL